MTRAITKLALITMSLGSLQVVAATQATDPRLARRAELVAISKACRGGQHGEVVRRANALLEGAITGEERLAALSLLGTSLAGLQRWEEASATLARARSLQPADPVLASLQFNCHTTAYGFDARAAGIARDLGKLLKETARTDRELAQELLFGALDVFVSPEVLVGAYRFALQQASRKPPARNYFDGYVGGEIYFESLQEGATDLEAAVKAVVDHRWQQASSAFWRTVVDVDGARDGYPLEAGVLHPVILGADCASAALAGDFGRAVSQSGMALQAAGRSPLSPQFRALANLVTPLRGSRLDREADRAASDEIDPALIYAVPDPLRSAVDLQAFSTIINNW